MFRWTVFIELQDRPRAEEAIKQMLNYSNVFLSGMKNLTEDIQIFTEVEIDTLEKKVNETEVNINLCCCIVEVITTIHSLLLGNP